MFLGRQGHSLGMFTATLMVVVGCIAIYQNGFKNSLERKVKDLSVYMFLRVPQDNGESAYVPYKDETSAHSKTLMPAYNYKLKPTNYQYSQRLETKNKKISSHIITEKEEKTVSYSTDEGSEAALKTLDLNRLLPDEPIGWGK